MRSSLTIDQIMKILVVVGTRPNIIKIAPILQEMGKFPNMKSLLVHTEQHYDIAMSQVFFKDLCIPNPDVCLGVGSGTHARQTADIMVQFEKVVLDERPDLIMVVGDVNSTLACSLVAAKLCVPVAHVEAGLRSFDRTMPEEINRIVTDSLAEILFTTCRDANENLLKEGIPEEKIFFVGNVMIDTLLKYRDKAQSSHVLQRIGLREKDYALLTLHRPSNVDKKETFERILAALDRIQENIAIVFPVHPRTRKTMRELGLDNQARRMNKLIMVEPLSYLDFIKLLDSSVFVMTDSGGLQEESTFMDIPCMTLRENTERPITITEGTNVLVGTDSEQIIKTGLDILSGKYVTGRIPELWDGHAAERIVNILRTMFDVLVSRLHGLLPK